jgi:hypothetical protein
VISLVIDLSYGCLSLLFILLLILEIFGFYLSFFELLALVTGGTFRPYLLYISSISISADFIDFLMGLVMGIYCWNFDCFGVASLFLGLKR